MKLLMLFIFAGALQICTGDKILALAPMPSRSHHNLFEPLLLELAKKGHEVTYISPFKIKPTPNVKQVLIPDLKKELGNRVRLTKENEEINMFDRRNSANWLSMLQLSIMGSFMMNMTLSLPEIQDFLKSDEKFDAIFGEVFLDESMLAGLSYKYKAPIIALATFIPNYWSNYMVGNPAPAAYIPDTLLGYSPKMTFLERVVNTVFGSGVEIFHKMYYLPKHDKIMRKFFGDDLPPIEDIIKNTSLVLVNHHYSLAFPRPYLPNMVEVGGYHVGPAKPLPDDLQKYMNESKNGVILFSMGSNLKSSQIPTETKYAILKAFSRLKQNVIWKFEDDTLTDLPKNVKISKWLPQSDILAHPNLKLFITHGGLLSTTEAVYRGVPVVGIPVFGDQPTNMKYTTAAGFGITLEYENVNEETMYNAITEVLNNPKYKDNVQHGSIILRDTPLPAMDTAIYWIEYVLRHKGAPHLRSAAQDLAWYQLYLLDVIGILVITVVGTVVVQIYITKFIFKRIKNLFNNKTAKVSVDKKKN